MGRLVRSMDWSKTPLGAYSDWPQSLRSSLSMVLNTKGIAALYWGPDQWLLYNDAYGVALGERHPEAFGRSMPEVLTDIGPVLSPQVANVLATGVGFSIENVPMTMHRFGRNEETSWTYSYSPVQGESGGFAGVLLLAVEMTQQLAAERRRDQAEASLRDINATLEQRVVVLAAERDQLWRLSRDPFVVCDLQGRWVSASPVWTEILGWSQAELLGRTSAWMDHPMDHDQTRQKVLDVGAGEVMTAFTNRFQTKDGSYRTFTWTAVAEGDRLFCVARDVTDEMVRAEALRLYANIVQSDTAPICAFDTEFRLIAFNQAHSDEFFRIYGYRVQIGDVFPDLFLPEQASIMRGFMERALTGEVFTVAEEFGNPDLSVPYWEVSYNPLRGADGRIVGAFHHAIDITARLQAQAALRATTTRAETYFRFSNDYLFLVEVDAGGIIRFSDMNPACEQVMGLVRNEIIGRTVDDMLPDDSVEAISHYARLCLETRQTQTYLAVREYKRGHNLAIEGRVTFIEGEVNGSSVLLFSGNDITERRQVEEQLRQAQKMEAVGQLTGGLAHDFNNLLTGIMGNLELLQLRIARGRLDEVDRFVTAAQGAGRRAASLTQRLLAFSRRQTLDPKPTDVNRLLTGMEDLLRRTVGGTVEVDVVGAAGLWAANIDAAQLENALLNLCINARDAMPDGGRITIETANKWLDDRTARERDLAPGQYLSICVTDTGTGMTVDTITHAFEPFFTTKPIGQGTGLGLSMIYGFARQSGGQVRIYSEIGQGTTVCVYLPRHHGDVGATDAAETFEMLVAAKGQTVLVVDDEPTIRHLLDEVLDNAGYTVINAVDGAGGLKVLQSGARIELLITDVGLPNGMNGRQVADAARVLRPGLKVLFITGYAENAAVGNGYLEPGMELLTKPFSMDALAAKVGQMMRSTDAA